MGGQPASPPPRTASSTRCASSTSTTSSAICRPGSGFIALDFFLVAHVGVLVVVPEPTSRREHLPLHQERVFAAAARHARRRHACRTRSHVRGRHPVAARSLPSGAARLDPALAARVLDEIHRFRPRIVVNQTRTRGDLELGHAAALGRAAPPRARRRLPRAPRVRRRRVAGGAQAAAADRRAPRVQGRQEHRAHRAAGCSAVESENAAHRASRRKRTEEQTLYEVLEIDPGASDEDIRRAYKRVREMYASESMVVCGLFTPERLEVVHAAHRGGVRHAARCRASASATTSSCSPKASRRARRRRRAVGVTPIGRDAAAARRRDAGAGRSAPSPIVDADTEFTGELLKTSARRAASTWSRSRSAPRSAVHPLAVDRGRAWEAMPATGLSARVPRRVRAVSTVGCAACDALVPGALSKGQGAHRLSRRRARWCWGYGLPSSGRQRFPGG